MTYLAAFVLFLMKPFINEFIMVDTNRIIKVPDLEFLVPPVHWDLVVDDKKIWHKSGVFFFKHPIDLFSGWSIHVNQLLSALLSRLILPSHPSYQYEFIKFHRWLLHGSVTWKSFHIILDLIFRLIYVRVNEQIHVIRIFLLPSQASSKG